MHRLETPLHICRHSRVAAALWDTIGGKTGSPVALPDARARHLLDPPPKQHPGTMAPI